MLVVTNLVRVLLSCVWTFILGLPLVVVIYVRYWYGCVRGWLGRSDVLDRVLEANAFLAGWVAQKPWTGILFPILGIRLRVRELGPIEWQRAHVIAANHTSLFDILALVRVVPPPFRFVAKSELLKWPIIGWALRPAGQIVVDRSDRSRALQSITEAAMRKIRGQVIFFVEGTRSRTGQLQSFKKGAFHFAMDNHLPILPTAIRGSYEALAKLPWWKLRPGRQIEVLFSPPVEPCLTLAGEAHQAAVDALRDQTRDIIAAALRAR